MKTIEIGTKVLVKAFPSDSFYKKAYAIITGELKNGYYPAKAVIVMSRWDKTFEKHPSDNGCAISVKPENIEVVSEFPIV